MTNGLNEYFKRLFPWGLFPINLAVTGFALIVCTILVELLMVVLPQPSFWWDAAWSLSTIEFSMGLLLVIAAFAMMCKALWRDFNFSLPEEQRPISGRWLLYRTIVALILKDFWNNFLSFALEEFNNDLTQGFLRLVITIVLFPISVILYPLFWMPREYIRSFLAFHMPDAWQDRFVKDKGALSLNDDQRVAVVQHLERIVAQGGDAMIAPGDWKVAVRSFTSLPDMVGDTVLFPQELMDSPYLGSVVVHSVARVAQKDATMRLSLAILDKPQSHLPFAMQWRNLWRQQIFAADEFTAQMGYGQEFIAFLNSMQHMEVARPEIEQTEPYIAERIARIQRLRV